MREKIRFIFEFAAPHKWKFAAMMGCMIATTVTLVILPYIIGWLIDEVIYSQNMSRFLFIAGVYGGVYVFNQIMYTIQNILDQVLGVAFSFDIRAELYARILRFKGSYLSGLYTGDVISRLGADVDKLNTLCMDLLRMVANLLNLLISLGFIFAANKWLGIFTAVITPVIVFSSRYFIGKAMGAQSEMIRKKGLLSSWLFEILGSMQEIRLLHASRQIVSEFLKRSIEVFRLQIDLSRVEAAADRINAGISLLAQMLLFGFAAYFVKDGQLTIGSATACFTYYASCVSMFSAISAKILSFSAGLVACERIRELFEVELEEAGAGQGEPEFAQVDEVEQGASKSAQVSGAMPDKSSAAMRKMTGFGRDARTEQGASESEQENEKVQEMPEPGREAGTGQGASESEQEDGTMREVSESGQEDGTMRKEPKSAQEDEAKHRLSGSITFRNVSFGYNEGQSVFRDLTFEAAPCETVAIVGHSGAGKSTLVNLLCRIYDPQAGSILIDGTDIRKYDLKYLRGQIGIVHQDSIMFRGTIRFNLRFDDDSAQDPLLWEALKMVGMESFVRSLEDGLDTVVGGKIAFSGGQRQRISIARAFVKNAPIMVFDESTSSLDGESEAAIRNSWEMLGKNHTLLIIAHRLSTIIHADKILVLEGGKVVGAGRHEELLRTCGAYYRLFREQCMKEPA